MSILLFLGTNSLELQLDVSKKLLELALPIELYQLRKASEWQEKCVNVYSKFAKTSTILLDEQRKKVILPFAYSTIDKNFYIGEYHHYNAKVRGVLRCYAYFDVWDEPTSPEFTDHTVSVHEKTLETGWSFIDHLANKRNKYSEKLTLPIPIQQRIPTVEELVNVCCKYCLVKLA